MRLIFFDKVRWIKHMRIRIATYWEFSFSNTFQETSNFKFSVEAMDTFFEHSSQTLLIPRATAEGSDLQTKNLPITDINLYKITSWFAIVITWWPATPPARRATHLRTFTIIRPLTLLSIRSFRLSRHS